MTEPERHDYSSDDCFRRFVPDAIGLVLASKEQYLHGLFDFYSSASPCQSPMEFLFFIWFVAVTEARPQHEEAAGIWISPQHEVVCGSNRYRLDFALSALTPWDFERQEPPFPQYPKLAVEIDGHDFHERTREQVEYRNSRDRDLQAAGWTVFHFSGSEVYRRGWEVALEVFEKGLALHRVYLAAYKSASLAEVVHA